MPTFPRSPRSFRTAGFPQYGWKAGLSSGAFLGSRQLKPLPAYAVQHPVCIRSSCAVEFTTIVPHCVGSKCRSRTALEVLHLRPRGPRSRPGYAVPVRHHLCDPIRPTRGHIALSPHGGLYTMPSLCGSAEATHEWFRAFAAHSFLTCRPLRPRGARTSYRPIHDADTVFAAG